MFFLIGNVAPELPEFLEDFDPPESDDDDDDGYHIHMHPVHDGGDDSGDGGNSLWIVLGVTGGVFLLAVVVGGVFGVCGYLKIKGKQRTTNGQRQDSTTTPYQSI